MTPMAFISGLLAAASANAAIMPIAIVTGTFILEDASTILVGVLAADGQVSIAIALVSLYVGIALGDFGLYGIGRLAATHKWASRFAERNALAPFHDWLETRLVATVFAARFVPGLRLPTYIASGFFRMPFRRFALSVVVATVLWTTLLFGASLLFGALTAKAFGAWRWEMALLAVVVLFLIGRTNMRRWSGGQRDRNSSPPLGVPVTAPLPAVSHGSAEGMPPLDTGGRALSSFEVAPAFLFYLPVAAYWLWLSIKHRSFTLPVLANPAITAGGLCGESKAEVLDLLGPEGRARVAPYVSFAMSDSDGPDVGAATRAIAALEAAHIAFPIVAKPDIGRRGTGVRPIHDADQLARYLERFPRGHRVVLQQLIPYEGEAGVFYVRRPDEPQGRILSLTLKYFPRVVGDGHSTLRELILNDRRAGQIPHLYFPRLTKRLDRVVGNGETVRLVFMGNHCKGAIFRDGQAYVTEAMRDRFDRISREMPGFGFGRFDVRFRSLDDLQRGEGFAILEVNGVGSEATHIWDRRTTLLEAYRTLCRQVRLAFEIGAMQRRTGLEPMPAVSLLRLYIAERKLMRTYPGEENDCETAAS
jgi:membrane protein DedA with SNARE-associated domain